MQGNLDQAISWLERGLKISEQGTFAIAWAVIATALGEAYALSGHTADALALLRQAAERTAATEAMAVHAVVLTVLAEALLLADQISEATPTAERALDLCRAQKQRGFEAETRRICGDIHMAQNPADLAQAEESYCRAMAMADELEIRPLAAHCHLGLGKLCHRIGKRQEAQEHLSTATTMYREMGMEFWLEREEAETKQF